MEQERLKVLLIEHDASLAGAISSMLEQAPDTVGEVAIVSTLEAGLACLKEANADVVLLEFFLPDGAGLANLPLLRAAAPHVPIVVLGSVDDEAMALESVHAGAQDYLVKNQLDTRWLLRTLRYAIERNQAELALQAAEELLTDGLSIRVINIHTIAPLDVAAVVQAARETGRVITVEDHSIVGGLGGAVAEALSEHQPTLMKRIGMTTYGRSGSPSGLYEYFGLDKTGIKKQVQEFLRQGKANRSGE